MPYENSRRYLNAFSEIENSLRCLACSGKGERFYQVIRKAAKIEKSIQMYSDDLKEFADLRNAIVHERSGGEPIAEPHYKTVLQIEKIRDLITMPPKVDPIFLRKVTTCKPSDRIGEAVKTMLRNSFSQIPIYEGEKFKGLLTTGTVSRWLADRLQSNIGILEEENVGVVASFCEYRDNYRFISRTSTLFDVLDCFDKFTKMGRNLDALIITQSGESNQRPLGIVTVFDLPEIFRAVSDGS